MRNQYLEQKTDVEELVNDHMELVRQIAWYMHGRVYSAVEIEDLIQIGHFDWPWRRKIIPYARVSPVVTPAYGFVGL